MTRRFLLAGLTLVVVPWLIVAAGDDKIVSGPQKNDFLPGAFDAFNVSGTKGKGRQHCLVCEYGLDPVVAIFAREPAEGKDGPLTHLLTKLDEILPKHQDSYLRSFVVFLSPMAQSSAIKPRSEDTKKVVEQTQKEYQEALAQAKKAAALRDEAVKTLAGAKELERKAGGKATDDSKKERERAKELDEEATKEENIARKQLAAVADTLGAEAGVSIVENENRTKLIEGLRKRADKLNNVVVAAMPDAGPKDYKIHPKAEVTILFYQRHKVLSNLTFEAGKMTEEDADRLVEQVDKLMREQRKKKK